MTTGVLSLIPTAKPSTTSNTLITIQTGTMIRTQEVLTHTTTVSMTTVIR